MQQKVVGVQNTKQVDAMKAILASAGEFLAVVPDPMEKQDEFLKGAASRPKDMKKFSASNAATLQKALDSAAAKTRMLCTPDFLAEADGAKTLLADAAEASKKVRCVLSCYALLSCMRNPFIKDKQSKEYKGLRKGIADVYKGCEPTDDDPNSAIPLPALLKEQVEQFLGIKKALVASDADQGSSNLADPAGCAAPLAKRKRAA
jgi:hypothetical protein